MSSVPKPTFGPRGFVAPTDEEILEGVQTDFNTAFGGNLNPALETPQGQLASSETAVISDTDALFVYYTNQVDPAYAEGRMQDAIARIYFLERKPALPTVVEATCVGLTGTVIPIGALARAEDGTVYICNDAGVIPIGGSITLTFSAQVTGPIPCPAGTLNQIYQAIPGWDTVNNASDGVIGSNVEGRADFEYRREQSVALNAHGSLQSIYGAVFNVDGVLDVYAAENVTSVTQETGATDYELAPHSLYVAAVGGDSEEIAKAIWSKKDVGCDYNGNTEVVITDESGYDYPYPTYSVKFERPAALPIFFEVEIANNAALPADIEDLTKAAIIAAFTGADGGTRARIGSAIFASRFYAPVSIISPAVSILSILIGTSVANENSVLVGIDQVPTIDASNITVTLV